MSQKGHFSSSPILKVTLLGDEWTSSAGGLSTLNRELGIHLSQHPKVEVSLLVPEGACKVKDKGAAENYGITVVEAKERPGYEPLDWLITPPPHHRMDVVVGHGVKLGRQVQFIRASAHFHKCKWVQVVHTAPEDLSRYKSYSENISKGERKHQDETKLCELADLVVPIGPRLREAYSSYLRQCKKDQDVFEVTPGLFDREFGDLEQAPNENAEFKVLLCGRGDDEDFELKGYNIAVKAFTDHRLKRKPYHLFFVGAPDGKQEDVRRKLLQSGIAEEQLTVRKFVQSRDRMKHLLNEVDLAIMPSKSEGFGLVALEAMSAGLPILVGKKSGFAKALQSIPFGKSCIVDSDDPTKWAEAIEGVRVEHKVQLEEIKSVRKSYNKTYSWKEQCEALVEKMWRMVYESPPPDEEKKASGKDEDTLSLSEESLQTWGKHSISGSTHDLGTNEEGESSSKREPPSISESFPYLDREKTCKNHKNFSPHGGSNFKSALIASKGATHEGAPSSERESPSISESIPDLDPFIMGLISAEDLGDEQRRDVYEMVNLQTQVYLKHHYPNDELNRLGALIKYVKNAFAMALEAVNKGTK